MPKCGLCLAEVDSLQTSHLMPAGLYKLARHKDGSGAPDPVVIGGGRSVVTSLQVAKPFLCKECEGRFAQRESWMLGQCARRDGFRLRAWLEQGATLRLPGRDVLAYNLDTAFAAATPYLEYFAASMFWRSGATSWRAGNYRVASINLGPYLEAFRMYLLGREPFPGHAALVGLVDSQPHPEVLMTFPHSGRKWPGHRHMFAIPGVRFVLFVGKELPEGVRELAINTEGPKVVFFENFTRTSFHQGVLSLVRKSPPVGKLKSERRAN